MKHTLMKFKEAFAMPLRNGLTKPSKVRGSGIPMVNMKEIFAYNKIYDDTPMELVPVTEKELENTSLEFGDLLFARQSLTEEGAGKVCIYNGHQTKVFESHLIRCRLDQSRFNSDYFYYFFSSSTGKALVSTIVQQTAAAGIRGSDLQELEIPVPPLPEQKAIASVLSSLDDKIDLLHRQNKTLEAMAETLFRQWFIEEAKEDWEDGTLDQLIDLKYGKALKQEDRSGSGYPVVASSGIVGFHNNYLVKGPSIVIGRKGTLGKVYFMEDNFYPIDTSYFIQTKTSGSNLIFEYYLLKSLDFANMNSDSAVPGLNRNIALGTQIQVPPEELILSFNGTAQPWFSKIHSNTKQIQTLEKLRDTQLPKLMSGEVRVQYQTEEVA